MTFRLLHNAVEFERPSRRDNFIQLQRTVTESFFGGDNAVELLHLCSAVIRALLRPSKYPDNKFRNIVILSFFFFILQTATKAAAKPVRRLTTKGKPTANEQAKQVRRKNQANMVTQVENAHDTLLKVQKGEIAVSDKEQEDLQVKAGFYARYITLDRFAAEKLDMLESFMNDKTCNSWLQRDKSTASPRPGQ